MKTRFLFVFFFCYGINNLAQLNEIYRLDEPGLFASGYELCFDSKGFLWLGTDKGLFKYEDYQSFKNIHPDTLYPKVVYSLIIDSFDRKWFIDLNQKINICENEEIKLYQPFADQYVSTYTFDKEDHILTIYTDKGVYNHHLTTNSIDTIAQKKTDEIFRIIHQSLRYADSVIYQLNHVGKLEVMPGFTLDTSLLNIFRDQKLFFGKNINIRGLVFSSVIQNSPYLFITGEEKIITGARDILLIFNKRSGKLQISNTVSNLIQSARLKSIQYIDHTTYIVNTYNGSYLFDPLKNSLQFIPESKGLIATNIQYYQNAIWLSTSLNGVYSTKINGIKFLNSVASKVFTLDNHGFLYVAEKGEIKIFKGTELVDEIKVSESQYIYSITNFDTQILIHLSNKVIYSLEKKNFNLTKIKAGGLQTIKHQDKVFSIGYTGLNFYDSNLSSYLSNFDKSNLRRLGRKRYRKFLTSDHSDYIYLGWKSGLDKYNTVTDEISEVLPKQSIQDIVEESPDKIWAGTIGNGVWKIENDSATQIIDKNNYLNKTSANALLVDGTQLWVGTDKGLIKMDRENYESERINRADGLLYDHVMGLAQTDSIIYIFTNQGIFYLNKQDSIVNNDVPKCYISNIKINQQDTSLLADYNLTNDENDISINFYANDIHSYGENTLKYRLASRDSSWTESNKNINTVHYQDLKHGSYKFEAYSSLPDDKQKSNLVEVSFEIDKHLHEKWWFRTIVSIMIAIFSIPFAFYFANRINKLLKLKNELQLEKMNSLNQQMNPHFIYNTLNAIQYFIFKERKIEAAKYLANFSDLVRKNFEHSNAEFISLEKEIEHIRNYLKIEALRFEDKVNIELIIQDPLNAKDLVIPPFFIQPLIENAFLHGIGPANKKSNIFISIFSEKDFFYIRIEDEGKGFKEKHKKRKYSSMDNIKKRIQLLNKLSKKKPISISISSLYPNELEFKGTRIELKFPV